MEIQTLTAFFMWCTILNGALFLFWSGFAILAPGMVYRIQSSLFPIPRETYDTVLFSFLGLFKIIYLFFNVMPYIALLIIA